MNKLLLISLISFTIFATDCDEALRGIKAVAGKNPYSKAMTKTMLKKGKMQTRAEKLAEKYPRNVKIVDSVTMHFEDANGTGTRQRKMVIISLNGLSDKKKDDLLNDYIDYLSWNSISFPLGEGGGHLYTRIGNTAIDSFGSFSQNPYRWPYSNRLETFVELSPTEFKNVKQYVENASINKQHVIGGVDYDGAHPVAGGTLAKNTPESGGHNCTSWIATAPIGEEGQTLKNIVGAENWDVHRNPGWWTAYIQTRGKNDRVPFVVYVTEDKMSDALAKASAEKFVWNYGLH